MRKWIILTMAVICFAGCQQRVRTADFQILASAQHILEVSKQTILDTIICRNVLDSALTLAQKHPSRYHDSLISTLCRLYGNKLLAKKPYEARSIFNMGLRIGKRQLPLTEDIIARLYHNVGISYFNLDDYKTALIYFDSVKTTEALNSQKLSLKNLTKIADCYSNMKDFAAAEKILRSIEQRAKKISSQSEFLMYLYSYSSCFRNKKSFKEAIDKADEGLNILLKGKTMDSLSTVDSLQFANCQYAKAYALHDSGDFKTAEKHYAEAARIYKTQANLENYRRTLSNLGYMYRFDKQFTKAIVTLTTGITLFNPSKADGFETRNQGGFYENRSEVYLETQQYAKAIADHDSAIYFYTLYQSKPEITAALLHSRPDLLSVLSDKAKACMALYENNTDSLGYKKALTLIDEITTLSDDIRADYFSDNAKLGLASDIKPIFEKAITLCNNLYNNTHDAQYLNKAFNIVEFSRSMVLYENTHLDNVLSTDLKKENEALKQREAALLTKNNTDDLQTYLRLKRQFREKIKSLNHNQLADVPTLQKALLADSDSTAFIEYFVGDSMIYVFTLTKNNIKLAGFKKDKDFEKRITDFMGMVTQPQPASDSKNFEQQSVELYKMLFKSVAEKLPSTISKLIIATDGVLAYVPFDILTPTERDNNFKNSDFLLNKFQISYAHSANFLWEQKRIPHNRADKGFAGFAPTYQSADSLNLTAMAERGIITRDKAYELKGAKEEVAAIHKIMGGDVFTNWAATVFCFKTQAPKYQILHCAMHSLVNEANPERSKLLFSTPQDDTLNHGNLTAAELYTMHLNAELAVLSACNTGNGKLYKGEGVMSLSRAFTYAGVPATVTSLWKVPDLTTREIMIDFYKNLKLGMTKDAALRQAKRTYLKNAPESIAANPYFWAGFVPSGNMEAIEFKSTHTKTFVALAIAIALLFSGLMFSLRKKKRT